MGCPFVHALLPAGAMLFAVLAELQVAREVHDLADARHHVARLRLAVHAGGGGGGRPWLRRLLAQLAHGLVVAAALDFHLRVQDAGAAGFLRLIREQ